MSTLLSSKHQRLSPLPVSASLYHQDPFLYVDRQAKHIQQNLQTLIDAQSEGLLAGLTINQPDDLSEGSSTPTSSSATPLKARSIIPPRQPPVRKIGLQAARKGIFRSIYELLELRVEERDILSSQAHERGSALHELREFTSKRAELEETISHIHNDQQSWRIEHLKGEAGDLETDIKKLETRLYEMKARHRHLITEISNIENSVDAKLSSYRESLSLLQSNIQDYLRDPPVQPLSHRTSESAFYTLAPKRRTLEMAREIWQQEKEDLQRRQQEVDTEVLALEEGGGVWKGAITDITGFEKRLRGHMRHYIQLGAQPSNDMQNSRARDDIAASVSRDLEQTMLHLEAHLKLAESRDWKLLVCCITAELEALREASGMLLPAFGLPHLTDVPNAQSHPPIDPAQGEHTDSHNESFCNDDPNPPPDLLRDEGANHTDSASRSEDDEPDPAWLLPES